MIARFQVQPTRSRGFTLVELLIVTLIISILATIVLVAMLSAQDSGRKARTRAQIAKIDQALMTLWEDYRVRRVPVNTVGMAPIAAARARLDALREFMRMEMPDRKTDVVDDPVRLPYRPARSQGYLDKATALAGGDISNWTVEQQGAECLYLILGKTQLGEKSGLEYFRETEFGDVDEDGMPEILDGWGTPIRFLRWAPGFVNDGGANGVNGFRQRAPTHPAGADPDPFDPASAYGSPDGTLPVGNAATTFFLHPFVVSAGPDREWDIAFANTDGSQYHYKDTTPPNDPYSSTFGAITDTNGDSSTEAAFDNIHNHLNATGQ